jgi:predicted nucleotidyltransferase
LGFERVATAEIRAVVQKIVEGFNPERVILFDSCAYGKPTHDSDMDILVIMESDERPAARATRVITAVQDKTFPMDILVRTPKELAERHRCSLSGRERDKGRRARGSGRCEAGPQIRPGALGFEGEMMLSPGLRRD